MAAPSPPIQESTAADVPQAAADNLVSLHLASAPALAGSSAREQGSTVGEAPKPGQTVWGPVVGHYEILSEIASGGMGVVFKARDVTALDRVVALKALRGDLFGASERMAQRLRREARAVAQLSHPNIVTVYDFGEEPGRQYIAMAYAGGGCLATKRARFTTEPAAAVGLLAKVARAVQHAHEHGILHRDLKPSNVLLTEQGEPLVADFGLAKCLDTADDLTCTGEILGTPSYMAPEQATGRQDKLGPATDVWALGVMLFELLTGQRPFTGESKAEILDRVRTAEPTWPPTSTALDPGLRRIVAACLAKEPSDRYVTAAALADDLQRWLDGQSVHGRPRSFRAIVHSRVGRRTILAGTAIFLMVLGGLAALALMPTGGNSAQTGPGPVDANWVGAELDAGRSVELVGAVGPPTAYRLIVGDFAPSGPDEPLALHSWRLGFLELLARPPRENFRLRAEVHIDEGDDVGKAGLYAAFNHLNDPRADELRWTALAFDDQASRQSNRRATTALYRVREIEKPATPPYYRHLYTFGSQDLPPRDLSEPWREVVLEFRRGSLTCIYEGRQVGLLTWEEAGRLDEDLSAKGDFPRPKGSADGRCDPHGGIGLFVDKKRASFRHVSVEPLNP